MQFSYWCTGRVEHHLSGVSKRGCAASRLQQNWALEGVARGVICYPLSQ